MSTISKQLLNAAATAAFAIAATATTVTSAFAQTSAPAAKTSTAAAATSTATAPAAASGAVLAGTQPAALTREQVQAAYLEARKNGTLIETEADLDVAQTRKHYAK